MTSKNILLVCLFLCAGSVKSQQVPIAKPLQPQISRQPVTPDSKLYITPTISPEFRGGEAALKTFLEEHLDRKVPIIKKAPAGQYIVVVRCIIGSDGALMDVSPESRFGYGMEQEAVR